MKKSIISIWVTCVVSTSPLQAEMAAMDDALAVANNWIRLIVRQEGNWGGSDTPEVIEVQEFMREQRGIGYFCRVSPRGYIVVSVRRELAPVKAYSTTCDLDPASEEGMSDLIKGSMTRILDSIESSADAVSLAQAQDVSSLLEVDYRPAWLALESRMPSSSRSKRLEQQASGDPPLRKGGMAPLLSSRWKQGDPYNDFCPVSGNACEDGRCPVGCTPLAGAQVMRYWAWPPWYDWANIPDSIEWSFKAPGGYYTDDGRLATQTQIDAVADLCYLVGVAVDADWCNGSARQPCATGASFGDLLDAFEDDFRFNDAADDHERDDNDSLQWFNMIRTQLDKNRPVPYVVRTSATGTHVVVCDGWQEYTCGGTYIRQYHMNYGWAGGSNRDCDQWSRYGSSNVWITLDELPCSRLRDEEAMLRVYPGPSIGKWLSDHEVYPKKRFNYRYFDQDAMGPDAIFEPGQNLQFLAGVKVTRSGDVSGGPIQFLGANSDRTRLFSIRGTASGGLVAGIQIHSGAVLLQQDGSIRFHPGGPEGRDVDLCDLGEPYRDFDPRTLSYRTADQLFTIWSILSNRGTVESGPFKVRFYASVDTIIAEGDHVLGEADVDSLASSEMFSFRWDVIFPYRIPKGTYYVGWVLDADDQIGETNELNNGVYKEGYRLVVQ